MSGRTIYASTILAQYQVSVELGLSPERIEAEAGLSAEQLREPEARVSEGSVYRHLELAYEECESAAFALGVARAHTISTLGVVGFAAKSCPTVGSSLRCFTRYQHLTNKLARFETRVNAKRAHLEETRYAPATKGCLLASELSSLIAVSIFRKLLQEDFRLHYVAFRRQEIPERPQLEEFVGAPIRTGASNSSVCFPAELLDRPLGSGDPELFAHFQHQLEAALRECSRDDLLAKLHGLLAVMLQRESPTLGSTAKELAMSPRTLQRRLHERGVSFASLVDETKKRLAREYLKDANLSVTEAAYLVGYSDTASFYRAFRRWFGFAPSALRSGIAS